MTTSTPTTAPTTAPTPAGIRGLTLAQPWAELVASRACLFANRSYAPPESLPGCYVAIHAAKAFDDEAWLETKALLVERGVTALPRLLARMPGSVPSGALEKYTRSSVAYGAIVAVARFGGCVTQSTLASLSPDQQPMFQGPYAWRLLGAQRIASVPCRGGQGAWAVPAEVLDLVRSAWKLARAEAKLHGRVSP